MSRPVLLRVEPNSGACISAIDTIAETSFSIDSNVRCQLQPLTFDCWTKSNRSDHDVKPRFSLFDPRAVRGVLANPNVPDRKESANNTRLEDKPASSSTVQSTLPALPHRQSQLDVFRNWRSQYEAFLCSQTRPSFDRAKAMTEYLDKWSEDWARMEGVDKKSNVQGKLNIA